MQALKNSQQSDVFTYKLIPFMGMLFIVSLAFFYVSLLPVQAAMQSSIRQEKYICDMRHVEISVSYVQTEGGDFFAVLQVEGKQIPMKRRILWRKLVEDKNSQGDAKANVDSQPHETFVPQDLYIALDEQDSYRWKIKENSDAKLSFLSADHTAEEETIYENCKLSY